MPTIEKTGTYKDGDGNTFFYREGHPVEQWQKDDLALVQDGLPLTENEKKAAERAEDLAKKREESAKRGAPENRAVAPPENRGGVGVTVEKAPRPER